MSERLVTVAAAQVAQTDTPIQNLEKMIWVMDQVKADVVVFPETHLSGLNQTEDLTPYHRAISEQAQRRALWVVYGSYHRVGNLVHNTAQVIDRRGSLRLDYRKKHLWNEEGVTPGSTSFPVKTEIGNLGVVICWDLANPLSVRELVQPSGGEPADIVFCPSYWFGEEFRTTEFIDRVPLVRAFENQVYIVYCDAYTENGETAARSKICSPLEILAVAQPQKEQIITATLDLDKLSQWRKTFNCWR